MKIQSPKNFVSFCSALDNITKEVVFRVDGEGLSCLAMGTSNVNALIATFNVENSTKAKVFGVDTSLFVKCLKSMKGEFEIIFPNEDSVSVIGGTKRHTFTMLSHTNIREAKQNFVPGAFTLQLTTERFKEILSDVMTFGETIKIRTNDDVVEFSGANDSYNCFTSVTEIGANKGQSVSKYNATLLKDIEPLFKDYPKVVLSWADNYPIHLLFENEQSKVEYILAQRSDI